MEAAQQLTLLVDAKKVSKARKRRLATAIGPFRGRAGRGLKVAQIAPKTLKELNEDEVDFDWARTRRLRRGQGR